MTAGDSGDNELNLTPLLDVVLQLIMFFLITVNFERQNYYKGLTLPAVQVAVPVDPKSRDRPENDPDNWVFLNLTKDGQLIIPNVETMQYDDNKGLALDTTLQSKLERFLNRTREKMERFAKYNNKPLDQVRPVIVLRADQDVRYEHVYNILDLCNNAGYRNWQLRVLHKPK
jgi:biopolymer transport protein ExbD